MAEIALIFTPEGGSTEVVANKIAEIVGKDKIDLIPASKLSGSTLNSYNKIIFGIATVGSDAWDTENVQGTITQLMEDLTNANWSNKKIALFGLGNAIAYSSQFVDDMGVLGEKLLENNATIVGRVPVKGYEFKDSKALINGEFIGLPIDEDTESEKTKPRITNWLASLKNDFEL